MELTFIEMVAYQAAHSSHDLPWRCTACEKLTPHSDADIFAHLLGAHNLPAAGLSTEDGAIYFAPKNLTGNSQEVLSHG